MPEERIILHNKQFELTIDRLCYQLIENYDDFRGTCLIGIQPRGVLMSDRIYSRLVFLTGNQGIEYGKLDITFYRDDFRTRDKPLVASVTEMNFLVEGKQVILIDDVLYTGRTVQSALTALQHYGRPRGVELMALVDRRFNRHLPIQADYAGIKVDALDEAYVKVEWTEQSGQDRVVFYSNKS